MAERGSASSRASSPKKSPGRKVASWRVPLKMPTFACVHDEQRRTQVALGENLLFGRKFDLLHDGHDGAEHVGRRFGEQGGSLQNGHPVGGGNVGGARRGA